MNTREKLSWTLLGVAVFFGIAAVSTDTSFFKNASLTGWLSLSGETNRLTVAGDSLLLDGSAIGGGGESLWTTNSDGWITPAGGEYLTNTLVFKSGLADSITNAALVVDTDKTWQANAHLLRLLNFGTNALVFRSHGHLSITGPSYSEVSGSSINNTNFFDIYVDNTTFYFQVWGEQSGELWMDLQPTVDASTTPYTFNTDVNHTSGNLIEIQNAGSAKLTADYRGAVITQGGSGITPATAGSTGVAGTILWDSGFIYVCVATDTWKRVAITTW